MKRLDVVKQVGGVVIMAVALIGCSDSDAPDTPPGLDRIDGPAQVDPSFDPFATVPDDGG